jgi:hypothetical protein
MLTLAYSTFPVDLPIHLVDQSTAPTHANTPRTPASAAFALFPPSAAPALLDGAVDPVADPVMELEVLSVPLRVPEALGVLKGSVTVGRLVVVELPPGGVIETSVLVWMVKGEEVVKTSVEPPLVMLVDVSVNDCVVLIG